MTEFYTSNIVTIRNFQMQRHHVTLGRTEHSSKNSKSSSSAMIFEIIKINSKAKYFFLYVNIQYLKRMLFFVLFFSILTGWITIFIIIVGVTGNLLTIIALLQCPRIRNVTASFIIRYVLSLCMYIMHDICLFNFYKVI